ncbi:MULTISPECIES: SigE family RNA polymerase sigma factor [unclassified Knoellia]|uniref:SigE family RNA polymerase sigma factor n=1 Tax=Knoellia altitudinis TaxID=3404795 RepID=UPI00360910DE
MDRGDEAAFAEFVTREWTRLVRVAFLLTGDLGRAEDLVQQTLVKVHRHWVRVHRDGSPYGYTRAALVNESTSWWRRKRVDETLGEIPAHADRARSDAYAGIDNRQELIQALAKLPPRMRAVIVLRFYDDLSEAEAAHALGISVGSVKSQTSRGLIRMRAAITDASEPGRLTPTTSTKGA